MSARPASSEEIVAALRQASASRSRVQPFDLRGIDQLIRYTPEDMTATVQGGMTLAHFQTLLRANHQWLPSDPPNAGALTIADLLAYDRSGPRRYGFGTIRDYLIGIKVALASGEVIKAGGNVVKNVAGYDLCKLFIGSKHSLGIILEATFKLKPVPEQEAILHRRVESLEELERLAAEIRNNAVEPVVMDAHNLGGGITLVVAFSGAREDVEEQCSVSEGLGFTEASLENDGKFHSADGDLAKASVLPSKTVELLARIAPAQFIARYGNGVVYYRGSDFQQQRQVPEGLMRRVKEAYDPLNILPEWKP